jgi:hypothetical protein
MSAWRENDGMNDFRNRNKKDQSLARQYDIQNSLEETANCRQWWAVIGI